MTKHKWLVSLLFSILAALITLGLAAAQQPVPGLVDMMLDCAMHEDAGPWVPQVLRADGLLRFNYLHEISKRRPGPYDYEDERPYMYVAFWNVAKTKAEFLDFSIATRGPRHWLTVSNDGQIYFSKGKLDLDFFQGGEWMRSHYMIRVRQLYAATTQTIALRDIRRTGVLCDSFANPNPESGKTPPAEK